jgi:hypothetical protein
VKAKLLLMTCCLAVATAQAGRFEGLTQRFSKGEKMTPVAATFFGGSGGEEFVDVGQLPDGTIVAFGNSTGPDFPATPKPVVLGLGKHQKLEPYVTEKNGNKTIAAENPDLAGMLVFYDEKLSRVLKTVKFDWGVASLSLGAVGEDGQSLFVAGRCTEAFRALAKTAKSFKVEPYVAPPVPEVVPGKKARKPTAPAVGPYNYQGATHPGDVFVAKLAPTGDKLEWVWIFEGLRKPPEQIWTDKKGSLYFEVRGMRRITADGQKAELINAKIGGGQSGWRAVDPNDGGPLYGGDRNTNTGYQPYRQPYLYKFDDKGNKLWTLWEPNPKECACGGTGNGLCSDSSARGVAIAPNGDIVVMGWSDGGNSVFTRQPTNWREAAGKSALGMESWGMKGASSLAYLMVIDGKTFQQKAWTLWLAYVPDNFVIPASRGAPNGASIQRICGLVDGSIGFTGGTATGLIQTPNALYKPPTDGRKYGGTYVAVMTEKMDDLLFSSCLPGCDDVALAHTKRGLVAVSRSRGRNGDDPPAPSPTVNPVQGKCNGELDGHILLLELPAARLTGK